MRRATPRRARGDEEMPRVGHHAQAAARPRSSSSSRSSRSCTSCCRSSSACSDTWNRIEHGNALVAGGRGACSRCCPSSATSRCSGPCSSADDVADRLARELPDHDGRAGGDAAVRGRWRRRDRADGAGRCVARAWSARIVACRMVAFMVLLYARLHGHARDRWARAVPRALRRPGARSRSPSCRRSSAPAVIAIFLAVVAASGRLRTAGRPLDEAAGRYVGASRGSLVAACPRPAATGVRTAIALVRTRDPTLLGAVAWWGFDIAVAVGVLPRLRRARRRRR